jgi:hypothetical protein
MSKRGGENERDTPVQVMPDYVFVCYARQDQDFALKLAASLKERSVPVWLDQWNIAPSADWDSSIDGALESCARFLIVLSPASVASKEVRSELRAALDRQKPVLPVLHQPCTIPRQLLLIQYVSFISRRPEDESLINDVVRALKSSEPVPHAPAVSLGAGRRVWVPAVLLLAAAITGIGIWWASSRRGAPAVPSQTAVKNAEAPKPQAQSDPATKRDPDHDRTAESGTVSRNPHRQTPVVTAKPLPTSIPTEPPVIRTAPPQWPTFHGSYLRSGVAAVLGPKQPRVVWTAEVGGQLRASPVIAGDGTIYIGSTDKNLYAIRDGKVLWTFAAQAIIQSTPTIDPAGTAIYFSDDSGAEYSVTPDGQKAGPRHAVLHENYAKSPDGAVYHADGSVLKMVGGWSADLGEPASIPPAVDLKGNVFVGSSDGTLHCFDRNGRLRWRYKAPARITTSPALKEDGDVIFGDRG